MRRRRRRPLIVVMPSSIAARISARETSSQRQTSSSSPAAGRGPSPAEDPPLDRCAARGHRLHLDAAHRPWRAPRARGRGRSPCGRAWRRAARAAPRPRRRSAPRAVAQPHDVALLRQRQELVRQPDLGQAVVARHVDEEDRETRADRLAGAAAVAEGRDRARAGRDVVADRDGARRARRLAGVAGDLVPALDHRQPAAAKLVERAGSPAGAAPPRA